MTPFTKHHFNIWWHLQTEPTRFQVAELGQRSHIQMLQIEGVSLPASQIPHNVLVYHTHTSQLHQRTEQQGDLTQR